MKAKSKVMLGLAAMLGVSAAVASYSTYAWFITTRIASVKIDSVGARSNDGSLYLTGLDDTCINLPQYKLDDAVAGEDDQGTELTFAYKADGSDNIPLTDVSSDGKTFYKPIWNAKTHGNGHSNDTPATSGAAVANKLCASEIKNVTTGDGDSADTKTGYEAGDEYLTDDDLGYFKQFKFKVTNTGTNDLNVYMSKVDDSTALVTHKSGKKADGTTNLEIGGYRLAVLTAASATATPTVAFYYAPVYGDNLKFIQTESGKTLYDKSGYSLGEIDTTEVGVSYDSAESGKTIPTANKFIPIVDGTEDEDALDNQLIVSNLEKDKDVYVTINIWVEGESKYTDVESMNGVVADFAFNLVALGADAD